MRVTSASSVALLAALSFSLLNPVSAEATTLAPVATGAPAADPTPVGQTQPERFLEAKRYDPAKVIFWMGNESQRLKIVVAHRGNWGKDCPENSWCSVKAADTKGIEASEVDVVASKEGTPWLFHDRTVGRTTNFSTNGHLFDPTKPNTGANAANNPQVSSLADRQLSQLKYRDRTGAVPGQYQNSVRDLLRLVKGNLPNHVIVLDIKDANAVAESARIVRELGLHNQVVLKFSVGTVPADQLGHYTQGLHFIPTVYTPNLDPIVRNHRHPGQTVLGAVTGYLDRYRNTPGFVSLEVGAKTNNQHDPLHAVYYNRVTFANDGLGNFSATPEVGDDRYYNSKDGTCCVKLTDYLAHSEYFGQETADHRTDLTNMLRHYNWVITDSSERAMQIAYANGWRAWEYKVLR